MNDNEKREKVLRFFTQAIDQLDQLENKESSITEEANQQGTTAQHMNNLVAFSKYKIETLEHILNEFKSLRKEVSGIDSKDPFYDDFFQMEAHIVRELNGTRIELNNLQGYNYL